MGDDYHTNYNELISIEKTLNAQITELEKCVEGKTNSVKLEITSWLIKRKEKP